MSSSLLPPLPITYKFPPPYAQTQFLCFRLSAGEHQLPGLGGAQQHSAPPGGRVQQPRGCGVSSGTGRAMNMYIYLSTYLFIYLSTYLFIYLSTNLSISIYLSIYLSTCMKPAAIIVRFNNQF